MNAIDHLRTIEGYADDFVTHWVDGETAEDQKAARETDDQIIVAAAKVKAALDAASGMLAVLQAVYNKPNGKLDSTLSKQAREAIAAAEAAGIAAT